MAKRKQPKSNSRRKAKRAAPGVKVTAGQRGASPEPKTGAAATIAAMFKRTATRIREIERAALSRLRGKRDEK